MTSTRPTPGRRSLDPRAFDFLVDLGANNTRAWFAARADEFASLLVDPFADILADASAQLSAGPWPLAGNRSTIFRQLRDQRYAKAVPYATSVRALMTSSGTKPTREGCVHVEINADGGFVGVGFHRPPATFLAPIRQRMVDSPEAWSAIHRTLGADGHPLADDRLTRMPRGFERWRDDPVGADLRLRSIEYTVELDRNAWTSGRAADAIAMAVRPGMALLRFGNEAAGITHPRDRTTQ
ncbi:MAG: TIGR02453 family protein [Actinomycetota bacterium]